MSGELQLALLATLSSYCFDYCLRQKVGGPNINFFIVEQAAVPPPTRFLDLAPWGHSESIAQWINQRTLELVYTSVDLAGLSENVGWRGPPFRWNSDRRVHLRAELEAAAFLIYGFEREDVDYIMDAFPIVRQNEEIADGEYRSKRLVLEVYDAMSKGIESGKPYETTLNPPPSDARVAHPPR